MILTQFLLESQAGPSEKELLLQIRITKILWCVSNIYPLPLPGCLKLSCGYACLHAHFNGLIQTLRNRSESQLVGRLLVGALELRLLSSSTWSGLTVARSTHAKGYASGDPIFENFGFMDELNVTWPLS